MSLNHCRCGQLVGRHHHGTCGLIGLVTPENLEYPADHSPDEEEASLELMELFEPEVANLGSDDAPTKIFEMAMISTAISLRRIADALTTNASLDEVLTGFNHNLANTLAEHRMYSK